MLRIALTGGIACGKSLAGACMARKGVAVCDADELAHALMAPGTPLHQEVVRAFGTGILGAGGGIARQALGRRVFADEAERDRLNALVHPAVKQAWREWLAAREGDSESAAVIVPLLYEAGAAEGWDAVVCVYASPDVQMARLRARGLTEAESRQRVAAQMPVAAKAELADYVVVNNGTRRLLEEQVERVLKSMCER